MCARVRACVRVYKCAYVCACVRARASVCVCSNKTQQNTPVIAQGCSGFAQGHHLRMPCHTSLLNAHLERCHVITTHAKHHCICTAAQQSGRSRGYHTCGAARGHRKRVRGSMLYTWPPLYTSRSRGYHTCGAALAVAILPRTSTALYDIRGACGGHTATNQYYII